MALTLKVRADGTTYPQGDTQGLLIPIDREPDFDSGIITDVTSGSKILTHNLNTSITNLDIVVMLRRTSDQTWQRVDSELYYWSGSNYGFTLGGPTLNTLALYITSGGFIILTNSFTTLAGATDAFRIVCWKKTERIPYIIANKGALVSSDDVGEVKINADDGTMSVNGEIDSTKQYSLSRPDLWPNGIEIDFGNNLYGMRKEGTISVIAGGSTQVGFSSNGVTKFIDGNGEYQRGTDTVWHSVNGTVSSGFRSMLFRQGNIRWALNCDYAITDAPYNVWVTYKR